MLRAFLVVALLLCTGMVYGQKKPVRNVSGKRHPNIAAAQRLTQQAAAKIDAAQQANEFDMGGHAKKAKELLDEANQELKKAAEEANENKEK